MSRYNNEMSQLSVYSMRYPVLARALPYVAVVIAMISFSVGASFAKTLFPVIGAPATTAYRVGLAALLLIAIWRPWRFKLTQKSLGTMLLYGLSVAGMNLLFFMSLERLPIGPALAIEFTGPLALALMHARKPVHFLCVGLAVVGILLLLPLGDQARNLDPVGMMLAGAAGVFWALYIVFGRKLAGVHPGASVSIGMVIAAVIIVPIGVANAGAAMFNPVLILPALALALLSSAIPYTLEMFALRHMPERTFGVLISADPAVGALAGLIIVHEHLSGQQWLAILAVVAAAAGAVATTKKEEAQTLPAE